MNEMKSIKTAVTRPTKLNKKIFDSLKNELKIEDNEGLILQYVMKRREQIIEKHIKDVYPIGELHQKGAVTYYTKLNPKDHDHCNRITASTKERLEDKIVAHYLALTSVQNPSLSDLLGKALESCTKKTADKHRQLFNKNLSALKNIKIQSLKDEDIHSALSKLTKAGVKKKEFDNTVSVLNKINDYCEYHHIKGISIRQSITTYRRYFMKGKSIFTPVCKDPHDTAFDEMEAIALLNNAMKNPDFYNLGIALLLTTGLRMSELLAVKVKDIHLKENYINICRMEDTKSYEIIEGTCKAGSVRQVFLNEDAKAVIDLILKLRKQVKTTNEFLLVNPLKTNEKVHISSFDKYLRALQVELGFDETKEIRSPHDCRRTYASIQYLKGVDITIIQKQLGHTTAAQTWEYIKDIIDMNTRMASLNKGTLLGSSDNSVDDKAS